MDFSDRIRELRKARGLTQKQVSTLTGISQNYVSRLEVGRSVPTLRTLELLAGAFEIDPRRFLVGAGRLPPFRLRPAKRVRLRGREQRMLEVFRTLAKRDQKLLLSLALWVKNRGRGR